MTNVYCIIHEFGWTIIVIFIMDKTFGSLSFLIACWVWIKSLGQGKESIDNDPVEGNIAGYKISN